MSSAAQAARQAAAALHATLVRRALLRPTYIVPRFTALRLPPGIECVLVDKDNCVARPHATRVDADCAALLAQFAAKSAVYVLSNEAGDGTADPDGRLARAVGASAGVPVMQHALKKPLCADELRAKLPCAPERVLVVGDRLYTDVLLANRLGAQSAWVCPGLYPSFMNRAEMRVYSWIKGSLEAHG